MGMKTNRKMLVTTYNAKLAEFAKIRNEPDRTLSCEL